MLSAQCTDRKVNLVTPTLFKKYPTANNLAKASQQYVEEIIRPLGLYKNKARNIILTSRALVEEHGGEVPGYDDLVKLPGVGRKTAGVVLAETAGRPAIPVDTHIQRVSKRLGIAKEEDDAYSVEQKLEAAIEEKEWISFHHRFIAFGREICHAKNPNCEECPFRDDCLYFKKASSKAAKKS